MGNPIYVSEPCHESWNDMTANDKGRHCMKCSKTVIDFTHWEQQDILLYLKENSNNPVCGRFRNEQLSSPDLTFVRSIAGSPLPLYKKFAAILLLSFGFIQMSCGSGPHTEPAADQISTVVDTFRRPFQSTEQIAKSGTMDTPQPKHKQKSKIDTEYITVGFVSPAPATDTIKYAK